jgi:hypothetical protein
MIEVDEDKLYALVKEFRETRKQIPKDTDANVILRYRLSVVEYVFNKLLQDGHLGSFFTYIEKIKISQNISTQLGSALNRYIKEDGVRDNENSETD